MPGKSHKEKGGPIVSVWSSETTTKGSLLLNTMGGTWWPGWRRCKREWQRRFWSQGAEPRVIRGATQGARGGSGRNSPTWYADFKDPVKNPGDGGEVGDSLQHCGD